MYVYNIPQYVDYKNHEKVSAQIMYNDTNLNNFFNDKNLIIMKEAIEDHRASLNREPRSIYGFKVQLKTKHTHEKSKKESSKYNKNNLILFLNPRTILLAHTI